MQSTSKNVTITSSAQTVAIKEAQRLVISADTACYIKLNLSTDVSPTAVDATCFKLLANTTVEINYSSTPIVAVQVIGTAGEFSVLAY